MDDALPGRVTGFYVVGSIALGAFRPGRSDIDFLAVVDEPLDSVELGRLRRIQRRIHDRAFVSAVPRRQWPLVCNGCYVQWGDFARPSAEAAPLASHVSRTFTVGTGFDVNPVTWRIMATCAIPVRGPAAHRLQVADDDETLREWNRGNLAGYWRSWAAAVRRPGWRSWPARVNHMATAWGALGAPRLHHTIATGQIISKEQAGDYARDVFDPEWHPVVDAALEYWRGEGRPLRVAPRRRLLDSADFIDMVIDSVPAA